MQNNDAHPKMQPEKPASQEFSFIVFDGQAKPESSPKKAHSKIRRWTRQEDDELCIAVEMCQRNNEIVKWSEIAKTLARKTRRPVRSAQQVSQRYRRVLACENNDFFDEKEVQLIRELHNIYGNSWALIAKHLSLLTKKGVRSDAQVRYQAKKLGL